MNNNGLKNQILQQLDVFTTIVETGGITSASKNLGISKAAVSQRLRLLESYLQTPLFRRTTRKMNLTEDGQLFFEQCQKLHHEVDNVLHVINRIHTDPVGTLTICVNPYLADAMLLPVLNQYLQKFPQVQIKIIAEERMPDMKRENVDLIFAANWSAPEDLIARKIAETRYVLTASPAYLKKMGTPKSIGDLQRHQLIHHAGRGNQYLVDLKSEQCPQLKPYLTINNSSLMKQCALKGMGIIQLHDYKLKQEIADGRLVELLKPEFMPAKSLYVYYEKHHFAQPKVRQFINLLLNDDLPSQ